MKLLTRHTDYAVRALVYMAGRPGQKVTAQELIAALKIPDAFLRGVLQALSRKGVLRSYKGKGGGFCLRKRSADIRLTDIMNIFQGAAGLTTCMLADTICPNRSTCPLRRRIKHIEKLVIAELGKTTIASLRP